MWLSVDRIEGDIAVLVADDEAVYHVTAAEYLGMVGQPPQETHVLWGTIRDGRILTARYDATETERRTQAARERLQRLINKNNRKG